jgi:hypothetical protein
LEDIGLFYQVTLCLSPGYFEVWAQRGLKTLLWGLTPEANSLKNLVISEKRRNFAAAYGENRNIRIYGRAVPL